MSAPEGLDLIEVTGLRIFGHHGVLADERRDGQWFVVDVTVGLDLGPAAAEDDLSRTVDYGSLSQQVHDAVATDPVDLIETVARRVADVALADPLVRWTRVRIHKPEAPIAVTFADVTVTIERSR